MEHLRELIDKYRDQEKMHTNEGRRGVENLCKLVRVLGYKDPMHFGQFAHDGAYGDLIEFLEDNSGAIDAILAWVCKINIPEWAMAVQNELPEDPEEEEELSEPTCTICGSTLHDNRDCGKGKLSELVDGTPGEINATISRLNRMDE